MMVMIRTRNTGGRTGSGYYIRIGHPACSARFGKTSLSRVSGWFHSQLCNPVQVWKTSLFQESLVRYRFGRTSLSQESLVGSTAGCESQHRFGRTSLFQVSLEKLHINFLIILWTRYQTSPRSGVDHVWGYGKTTNSFMTSPTTLFLHLTWTWPKEWGSTCYRRPRTDWQTMMSCDQPPPQPLK